MLARALATGRILPGVALLWPRLAWLTIRWSLGGGGLVGEVWRRRGWRAVEMMSREVG